MTHQQTNPAVRRSRKANVDSHAHAAAAHRVTFARALLAACVLMLFMIGTLIVPVLHLAFHALPHDHDGGAIRYHFAETGYLDDDDPHDELAHHAHRHRHRPRPAPPLDAHHGDGSLAHFSLALNDGAAASVTVTFASLPRELSLVHSPLAMPPRIARPAATTRGPPSC
jgi:hypothetical protein